jgi:hypothetical protein
MHWEVLNSGALMVELNVLKMMNGVKFRRSLI